MLIAAALIELAVPPTGTIKTHRSLANSVKERIRRRFSVSVAEVGDPEARDAIVLGLALVGIDPTAMRERMERVIRFVEDLGLAEVLGDDVTVARLDELPEVEIDEEAS
jgi:uncharacterized protein YlxP (DUF503 family)